MWSPPPCHVLFGISRIANPRCKFPCGRKPRNSERRYAGSDVTCPCLDQRPRLTRGIADRDSLCKRFTTLETPMPPNPDSPGSSATCPPDDRRLRSIRGIESSLSSSPCTGISRVPNPEIPRSCATCPVNRSTVPIESGNRYSRFQMVRNAYLHKRRSPISRWCLDLLVPKG